MAEVHINQVDTTMRAVDSDALLDAPASVGVPDVELSVRSAPVRSATIDPLWRERIFPDHGM